MIKISVTLCDNCKRKLEQLHGILTKGDTTPILFEGKYMSGDNCQDDINTFNCIIKLIERLAELEYKDTLQ